MTRVVETLLAHGAKTELTNAENNTSLMIAILKRQETVAELLIAPTASAGALNAQDSDGVSALMMACADAEMTRVVETLLAHGAQVCVCAHTHTHVPIHLHVCIHMYVHTYIHV